MKNIFISIALLFLTINSLDSHAADDIYIHDGFVDGNEFMKFKKYEKEKYAMGVIDGLLLAPLLGSPESNIKWLKKCVVGMNSNQVVVLLNNYLANNPAKWHQSMHTLSYVAIKNGCN